MTKHIIIGGDAAGMSAAMQIRRADKEAEIWAFEMGATFSYAQCGLPYYIEGLVSSGDKLIARTDETFNQKYKIKAKSYHQVTAIHPNKRKVSVLNLKNGTSSDYLYDKLLIATGASPTQPKWAVSEKNGLFTLKTLQDAQRIKQYIEQKAVKKAVIIGAGYIGLEMTEAFFKQGIDVTLIQRGDQVGGGLDRDMANYVQDYLHQHVQLKLGEEVLQIEENTNGFILKTNKGHYEADLVLLAIGVAPNSHLAEGAGIKRTEKGAILVDASMKTNLSNIYAAGDCAVQFHRLKKRNDYIPLGTHANKQGRIAGKNMAGGSYTFPGVVGTAIFKVMDLEIGRCGLTEKEGHQEGIDVRSVTITSLNHAGYYPEANKMHIKLLYERDDETILGAQIVGFGGVDKQIDVVATALFYKMKVHQLLELDLAYAPPFSSIWSPIQQAARVATRM